MTSRFRIGASAFSVNDGSDRSAVMDGYQSSWNASAGPPSSRARWAITAAKLPPAESPATAIRAGSPPNSAGVLSGPLQGGPGVVQPGGKGCSGASR